MRTKYFGALGTWVALTICAPALAQQPPYQAPPAYQPPPQYQQPPPQYQQPPPQYQQPPPQYQQPPPQYQQPPPQYQQPPPQYQQQPPQYQQQPPQYQQQPQPGYEQVPPPYQQAPPANPPPAYPPPAYPPPPPAYQPYQQPHTSATSSTTQSAFRYHPFRMQIMGGYTITENEVSKTLHDGGNVGLGFLWFPSSELPLGFRLDGSYSNFNLSMQARSDASNATGANISEGYVEQYGGDLDAELDLRMGPNVKEYLFGGFGYYKNRTTLKSVNYVPGEVCFFNCYIAYFPQVSTVSRENSDWMKSWNAGVGFEFALTDPVSFFVEARFMRITQGSTRMDFVPIRIGLRF